MGGTDLLQVCLARKPTHVLYILWPYFAVVKSDLYVLCVHAYKLQRKKAVAASKKAWMRKTASLSIQHPIIALQTKDLS